MSTGRPHRWLRAAANLALIAALLFAVSFLPPDTSLKERRQAGVLKLCVPPSYPPLVTGDPAQPGFDIELAQHIADSIGVRLIVNALPSMGRDFNPRNWQLSRAQCDMIAGGLTDTLQTRGFLQTIPTTAETGWVAIAPRGELPSGSAAAAVLPGSSGLDRLALSSWLRAHGLRPVLVSGPDELTRALSEGRAQVGFAERFAASAIGSLPPDFTLSWLPAQDLPRYQMALGLWKGDQTLMRAVRAAMEHLQESGTVDNLRERYGLGGVLPEQGSL
ncbi:MULTISPECIES: transporter substrate-binding domain-containing protein [unclassified Devosia]|uniref:substrate-binding periplasmic protein n=1 Tax=unclassified Devosia TaxID=196773 RepID=UPI00155775E0|nr:MULTISPECIES: transporter substrate-binding domain-containing protein [unclassified Devosia]